LWNDEDVTEQTTVDVVSAGQVRVTDLERRQAEERLRQGLAEGSLDLAEFDERAARLWQDVKTKEDLAGLTADLPAPVDEAQASRKGRAALLGLGVLNCVAWVIVFVTGLTMDQFDARSVDMAGVYIGWSAIVAGSSSFLGVWWATGFGRRRGKR
jgi:hypothetical protein